MEVEVTYRIAAHLRIVTEDNINMAIFMFIHAADNIVGCEVIIGIEKNTISDCANLMPKLRDTAALLFFFLVQHHVAIGCCYLANIFDIILVRAIINQNHLIVEPLASVENPLQSFRQIACTIVNRDHDREIHFLTL
ncbi:hypothetical protein AN414_01030 [Serratia marcescens]|nr:hypothetical protein AN414_01030 [Serratia marcescens]